MGYFPFFIDIKNKRIVIAGGGNVAFGKIGKLLPFEPEITVVAPEVCREIQALDGIKIIQREFEDSDPDGAFAVIAATDSSDLNGHIYRLCIEKNILINTVDDKDKCGFIFPALVKSGDVTVGISTSGKSPLFAKYLREYIEDELDDSMLSALEMLGKYRSYAKSIFPTQAQRKEALEAIFDMCLACGENAPDDRDIKSMLDKIWRKYEA